MQRVGEFIDDALKVRITGAITAPPLHGMSSTRRRPSDRSRSARRAARRRGCRRPDEAETRAFGHQGLVWDRRSGGCAPYVSEIVMWPWPMEAADHTGRHVTNEFLRGEEPRLKLADGQGRPTDAAGWKDGATREPSDRRESRIGFSSETSSPSVRAMFYTATLRLRLWISIRQPPQLAPDAPRFNNQMIVPS
jgi:hypothetical protein